MFVWLNFNIIIILNSLLVFLEDHATGRLISKLQLTCADFVLTQESSVNLVHSFYSYKRVKQFSEAARQQGCHHPRARATVVMNVMAVQHLQLTMCSFLPFGSQQSALAKTVTWVSGSDSILGCLVGGSCNLALPTAINLHFTRSHLTGLYSPFFHF